MFINLTPENAMVSKVNSPRNNTPCPGCGGSGETAYFGGESRFMLTREDCPDCCGTGILLEETGESLPASPPAPEELP